MDKKMIYGKEATLQDLYNLHYDKGFVFIVKNGVIFDVLHGQPTV